MKNLLMILAGIFMAGIFFSSCISPKKSIYFNDLEAGTKDTADINLYTKDIRIQIGDLIMMQISAIDNKQVEIFSPSSSGSNSGGSSTGRGRGFKVDEKGMIILPVVGEVEVAGLNTREAAARIKDAISKYVVDPFVDVTIQNFKVTVLGAVGSAGVVNSETDRLTIFEALAQSGDVEPSSLRNQIWVIRDENGKRDYAQINLNSKSLFKSDYYYLRNNDIVYVMPHPLNAYLSANAPVFATIGAISGLLAILLVFLK